MLSFRGFFFCQKKINLFEDNFNFSSIVNDKL